MWDSSAAHTSALLAARMALGPTGAVARDFQDAQRAYRAALARQQLLAQEKELTRQACHPLGLNVGGPSMRLPDEYGQA